MLAAEPQSLAIAAKAQTARMMTQRGRVAARGPAGAVASAAPGGELDGVWSVEVNEFIEVEEREAQVGKCREHMRIAPCRQAIW
jgi:hypothetical protein